MFKLDNNFLVELGLGNLPAEEKNKMLAHIYETLEMRVGMRLAEKMSNEQLDEFESFINNNDEAGALKWLESNFPNYKQVVAEELEKLKSEIKQVAPQIIGQAQALPNQVTSSTPDPLPQSAPIAQPPQAPMQPQPMAPQMAQMQTPPQNNFGMSPQQPLMQGMQQTVQQPPMFDQMQPQFQQPLPPPPMPLDPLPQSAPIAQPPQAPMQPQPMAPQMAQMQTPPQNNFGMSPQQPLMQGMQQTVQQPPMFDQMQPQFQQPLPPEHPGSVPAVPPPEYQQFIGQQPLVNTSYASQPMDQINNNNAYTQQQPPTAQPPEYMQQQNQFYAQQPIPPSNEFPAEPAPVYVPPSEGVTEIPHTDTQTTFDPASHTEFTPPPQEPVADQAPPLQFQPPVSPPKQPWQPPA